MTTPQTAKDFEGSKNVPSWVKLQKWLVLSGLLGATLIFFGVFYVWLQLQQVQYGYRIAHLQKEYEELLDVQRKLHLEWSRLHEPARLEEIGRKSLGLAPPLQKQRLFVAP